MSTASPTTSAPSPPPPSSGSDAPRRSCANCGAALGGPYCGDCGQREAPPDPTLRELAADAWDAIAGFDGKLVASLRLLVARPGALTTEYLAGRRARYFAPVKLYLACSLAFFVLEAVLPERSRAVQVGPGVTGVTGTRDPLSTNDSAAGVTGPEWSRRIQRGTRRADADGTAFNERLTARAPQAVFLLVPLHAVLLAAVYRNRRRNLPTHLVFALHGHAFIFCVLAATDGLSAVLPRAGAKWVEVGLLAALAVYFPVAMRRVYGGRWRATLARAATVVAGYSAGGIVVVLLLVFGTFYLMGAKPAPPAAEVRPPSPSATP